ncbi:MAG: hypothetical protein U5L96_01840 [Owenweeksia sp.]|nr:hypothetical protein [Owenweeksia sp.]
MEEISEAMQMAMMNMQSQSNKENMKTLRQILENLETLSFDIEDLSEQSQTVNKEDPIFKSLLTEQKRLQDGAAIIEDSLVALSLRVPQLEQVIFEELDLIRKNLDESIQNLEELRNAQAATNQQYVMTSANNLALMLDATLQQMMKMQAQMMQGKQNCQKPGGGSPKPSMQNMRKLQNELGEKMGQMQKGNKKGDGKEGEGKDGQGRNGKEIIEMLSRQEKLRRALQEQAEKSGSEGSKGNLQKAIQEMKKLEEDMLDGQLEDNYKERIKEIDTRLLENEKAELKQKKEEKRESESGEDLKQLYREELDKYLREKQQEQESIDRLPLNFRHFYKDQTSKYLNEL